MEDEEEEEDDDDEEMCNKQMAAGNIQPTVL